MREKQQGRQAVISATSRRAETEEKKKKKNACPFELGSEETIVLAMEVCKQRHGRGEGSLGGKASKHGVSPKACLGIRIVSERERDRKKGQGKGKLLLFVAVVAAVVRTQKADGVNTAAVWKGLYRATLKEGLLVRDKYVTSLKRQLFLQSP